MVAVDGLKTTTLELPEDGISKKVEGQNRIGDNKNLRISFAESAALESLKRNPKITELSVRKEESGEEEAGEFTAFVPDVL